MNQEQPTHPATQKANATILHAEEKMRHRLSVQENFSSLVMYASMSEYQKLAIKTCAIVDPDTIARYMLAESAIMDLFNAAISLSIKADRIKRYVFYKKNGIANSSLDSHIPIALQESPGEAQMDRVCNAINEGSKLQDELLVATMQRQHAMLGIIGEISEILDVPCRRYQVNHKDAMHIPNDLPTYDPTNFKEEVGDLLFLK